MTATGFVGTHVNLDNFYDNVIINEVDKEGIIYAEFGNNKHNQISKGTNLKKRFIRVDGKKQASTRRFDNSITIKYNFKNHDIKTMSKKDMNTLNIKIFKNGKIQMTGVKSEENGKKAIDEIIRLIKECQFLKDSENDNIIVENVDDLHNSDFCIHLINSDFKVDMEIRRDLLADVLINNYACTCSYEPCIYPGVKLQYFMNKNNTHFPLDKQGKCLCEPSCNGKGDGFTTDACKKITISVFQSGCILITGVTLIKHIQIGYDYITEIIIKYQKEIKRNKLIIQEE
jgi:TATA-box binding protein (TBP) (component of TFIID and TFIIIB)